MQLGELGPGFPLYFYTKYFTGLICFCMFIIIGVTTTYNHLTEESGGEWVDTENPVFLTRFTVGNYGKGSDNYYDNSKTNLIIILNSCFLLVLMFMSLILRIQQDNIIRSVDDKQITPSDFTIMAYNIPQNMSSEDFKRWLEDHHWSSEIKSLSYCYDIREMISL